MWKSDALTVVPTLLSYAFADEFCEIVSTFHTSKKLVCTFLCFLSFFNSLMVLQCSYRRISEVLA